MNDFHNHDVNVIRDKPYLKIKLNAYAVVILLSNCMYRLLNKCRYSIFLPETATRATKTKATASTVFIFSSYLGRAPV